MPSVIEQVESDVRCFAQRTYRRVYRHVQLADLLQEGYLAALQAEKCYDEERGARFKTFARLRIMGGILDYIRHLSPNPRNKNGRERRGVVLVSPETGGVRVCHVRDGAQGPDDVVIRAQQLQLVWDRRSAEAAESWQES